MKKRLITALCVATLGLWSVMPAHALESGSPEAVAADVLVARPACLAATIVGSAVFVLALPFAAMSKSVKKTGRVLVGFPARATFSRELGEFQQLQYPPHSDSANNY
jgi:hypothetical protein